MVIMRTLLILLTLVANICTASPLIYRNKQAQCLTEAIYYEARGTSVKSQWLVGKVVLNRVGTTHNRDSICYVVKEKLKPHTCQFSFMCFKRKTVKTKDIKEWEQASRIATMLLNDVILFDLSYGAMYYTRCEVKASWKNNLVLIESESGHCFYKNKS